MKLDFSNLHFDGEIQTTWQVLLGICGDFELWVGEWIIYSEIDFCLVGLAEVTEATCQPSLAPFSG